MLIIAGFDPSCKEQVWVRVRAEVTSRKSVWRRGGGLVIGSELNAGAGVGLYYG